LMVSAAVIRDALGTINTIGRNQAMQGHIWAIRSALIAELAGHKFARIPTSKLEWFAQPQLFGSGVARAFPLAAFDIREAGDCIALGLDTAAVFHLMRAAEHGLRHIARTLKISTIGKKQRPIEFENWNTICDAIDAKIEALNQRKPSVGRAKYLRYYSEMNAHIRAFKDCWRNDVSHARKTYNEHEAGSVFHHVRGFMQRLAEGPN
jgi:hypothetical protein